jgi:uncharacterized phage protein gp47/JayE
MIYGLTVDGFIKKPLTVIKSEIETKLSLALGETINTIPQSVFGVVIGVLAEDKALEWETQEKIYQSFYPSTAQGNALSELVLLNGIERILGETDVSLRVRREQSVGALGQNLADSLFGQLLNITSVLDALVLDNKTDITDANGIPPHRFMAVVQGGSNVDIGAIVWKNTPQGINSFGTSSVIVTDVQGNGQTVYFSRPLEIPIYFIINITSDASFPIGGETLMRDNIISFGASTFKIGDDVITSRFFTPVNEIAGVVDVEILISTTPTPTLSTNIPISIAQLSTYSAVNIIVNVI